MQVSNKFRNPYADCVLITSAGFSAEEPESGDEGAFFTDHTVKVRRALLKRSTLGYPNWMNQGTGSQNIIERELVNANVRSFRQLHIDQHGI